MTRHIKIEKSKVQDTDLTDLFNYPDISESTFPPAGVDPYRFYAYFSTLLNDSTIIEIGTRTGESALAAALNRSNKVITYDIVDWNAKRLKRDNIVFKLGDFMQDEDIDWANVDVVMIDVDPHDGIKERQFLAFLYEQKWEGILILDDILPNWPVMIAGANPQEMNRWWNSLTEEKYDVSDVAHFSGTGIVNIGNKFTIEIC